MFKYNLVNKVTTILGHFYFFRSANCKLTFYSSFALLRPWFLDFDWGGYFLVGKKSYDHKHFLFFKKNQYHLLYVRSDADVSVASYIKY